MLRVVKRVAMTQTDLFGNQAGQGELFGTHVRDAREWVVNADTVREKMMLMLKTARSAQTLPWTPRKAKIYETIFPQMVNWLPDDEANQLRFEFAQELERLKLAA